MWDVKVQSNNMMPTFAHEEKFYGDKVAVLIRSMCGIDRIKAHKKFTELSIQKAWHQIKKNI